MHDDMHPTVDDRLSLSILGLRTLLESQLAKHTAVTSKRPVHRRCYLCRGCYPTSCCTSRVDTNATSTTMYQFTMSIMSRKNLKLMLPSDASAESNSRMRAPSFSFLLYLHSPPLSHSAPSSSALRFEFDVCGLQDQGHSRQRKLTCRPPHAEFYNCL